MPDISEFEYIALLWNEVGMIGRGGMSAAPLTWQEVAAFSQFKKLNDFEASMIIEMSRSFINGVGMDDLSDPAPYKTEMTKEDWLARERTLDKQMGI